MKVELKNGVVSIKELILKEANQIKMSEINWAMKRLLCSHEENHFSFQLIQDLNEAQYAASKMSEKKGILVTTQNGLIDIPNMTQEEAHHIKIALIHLSKTKLSGTTIEDKAFIDMLITELIQKQSYNYNNVEKAMLCL